MPTEVTLYVEFHQFGIGYDEGGREKVQPEPGPLVLIGHIKPTYCVVYTGVASGDVRVTAHALSGPPDVVDEAREDVAEVSLQTEPDWVMRPVGVWAPDEVPADPLDVHGPGTYRLRVHARGRDRLVDGVAFEPVEDYLVLAWPAPYEPPATVRAGSAYARSELDR